MNTAQTYREILRRFAVDPEERITYTHSMWTTVGAHKEVEQLELRAFRFGLTCERRSTSGWFEREHTLRMRGTVAQVKQLLESTKNWLW